LDVNYENSAFIEETAKRHLMPRIVLKDFMD